MACRKGLIGRVGMDCRKITREQFIEVGTLYDVTGACMGVRNPMEKLGMMLSRVKNSFSGGLLGLVKDRGVRYLNANA